MSAHLLPSAFALRARRAAARTATEALALMVRMLRTRAQLEALDDRLLRDIGVSRAEALREAGKAPWQA